VPLVFKRVGVGEPQLKDNDADRGQAVGA
jgi:hypothetical protein